MYYVPAEKFKGRKSNRELLQIPSISNIVNQVAHLGMTRIHLCTKFVIIHCTLLILMVRGIWTDNRQQSTWYKKDQVNVRPVDVGPVKHLSIVPYDRYNPYFFAASSVLNSNNVRWTPYIPSLQAQGDKRPMVSGNQWYDDRRNGIKTGQDGSNTIDVRYVPFVAFLPVSFQTMTEQAAQAQDSSVNEDSSSDYDATNDAGESETTRAEEEKVKDPQRELVITEIPATTSLSNDDITRLIEEALRNGELASRDEWLKQYPATKQQGTIEKLEGSDDENKSQTFHDLYASSSLMPRCNDSTFCESVVNYPEELINQAIRNNSLKPLGNTIEMPEIEKRFGLSETEEWPLCRSYVRTIYPRFAKTSNQNWRYVINQNNYRQSIRVEVCVNEGGVCDDLEEYMPEGYKIRCKQNYIFRELMAVISDNTIGKDNFMLPSNCCCHREFVG